MNSNLTAYIQSLLTTVQTDHPEYTQGEVFQSVYKQAIDDSFLTIVNLMFPQG